MRAPLIGAVLLATAAGVSSCGSSPTASWASPSDVVGGMASAGVTCTTSANPTVETESRTPGIIAITCDDFGALLITDRDAFSTWEKDRCPAMDAIEWAKAQQTPIVLGSNIILFGTGKIGEFTGTPATTLATAVDGSSMTAADHYREVCDGISSPEEPAPVDTAKLKEALSNDLRQAATAMETYRSEKSAYPTSLDGVKFAPAGDSVITIARGTDTSYCLDITSPSAPGVVVHYDSEVGDVADGTCS